MNGMKKNMNNLKTKLFKSGRPFGTSLSILKKMTNQIPNDLQIIPEEILLNYEISLLLFIKLNNEIISNGLKLTDTDLNIFYQLPLFVSDDFVSMWEKDKIWKYYNHPNDILNKYDECINEKKPSFAYIPHIHRWYKPLWNDFFEQQPEYINEILLNSLKTFSDYRQKRPLYYNNEIYKNIFNICNIIKTENSQLLFLLNSLFNFKLPHTQLLIERFLEIINYNDYKFLSSLDNIFTHFNVRESTIYEAFSSNSILVKSGILKHIDIKNADFSLPSKNTSNLFNVLFGETLNIIGSKHQKNIISAIIDNFDDIYPNNEKLLPLSSWSYIEILNQCSLKLKMRTPLKILITGNSGTGKTSMAYSLLKNEGYSVYYIQEKDHKINNAKSALSILSCIENSALIIESLNKIDPEIINNSEIPLIILNDNQKDEGQISLHQKVLFDYTMDISNIPFKKRLEYAKTKFTDNNLSMRIAQQIKSFNDINKISRLIQTENDWDKLNQHIVTYNKNEHDFCSIIGHENIKDIPDFKGYEHINEYFNIIYDLFKNPIKYEKLAAKAPKGFLISGEPGTGKTLFVKQVAKKTKLPLISVHTSLLIDNIDKIKEVFDLAQGAAPCILFFDEIDSLLINPISPFGDVNTKKQSILNCMLTEIDGIKNLSGVIILGTTNHVHKISDAAKRSGRLSETININLPSFDDRKSIWKNYLENKINDNSYDVDNLALSTAGFSGADINEAVNQACLYAINDNKSEIEYKHLDKACEVILWGRGDKIDLSDESLWRTSVHETGHAMLALKYNQNLNRVTIIPRQKALGVTHILKDENKFSESKKSLAEHIEIFIAGIMAEKVIFGEYESGGSSDIKFITSMIITYFTKCGFSESIGFLNIEDVKSWSEQKKTSFEKECNEFVNKCAENVEHWLEKNKTLLTDLSQQLFDNKSLDFNQLKSWKVKITNL